MILFLFIDLFLICTESVIFIIFFVCISQHCVVSTNFTFEKKKKKIITTLCSLLPDHTHYLDAQAKDLRPNDEDDDDSDNDYSDDEELQSPIDEVDPFIFFVDTVKGK